MDKHIQGTGILDHILYHLLDALDIALVEGNCLDLDTLFPAQLRNEFLSCLYGVAGQIDIGAGIGQGQGRALAVHGTAAGNENILSL